MSAFAAPCYSERVLFRAQNHVVSKSNPPATPLTPEEAAEKARRSTALRVIFFTVFLDILGFGVIIPQLAIYATQFGATPITAGLLASTYSAMGFIFTPFWGRLSDRIGRRPVLLYSIFGTAVSLVLFGLASSLIWLFAARTLDGITGANISTAQAYISDITEEKDRSKTFGMFGAIFGIGFALGPAIGGQLAHLPGAWGGNLGLGAFCATLSFINWALALKFLPETISKSVQAENQRKDAESKRIYFNWNAFERALRIPNLNVVIVIGFLATAAFATMQGAYSLFVLKEYARPYIQSEINTDPAGAALASSALLPREHEILRGGFMDGPKGSVQAAIADPAIPYPPSLGGDFTGPAQLPSNGLTWRHVEKLLVGQKSVDLVTHIFMLIGGLSLVVQGGLIRPLQKRMGQVNMVLAGTLIMAASLACIPLPGPNHFAGQLIVAGFLTLGNGLSTPILTALVSEFAPELQRGEIIGIYQSIQSLGRIIGPLLSGVLFFFIAPGAPFLIGGVIMLSSFLLAFKLKGAVANHALTREEALSA